MSRERAVARLVNTFARRAGEPSRGTLPYAWDASFFGLDRVGGFTSAQERVREEVLIAASRSVLREARDIEESGIAFCARMTLGARTTAERQLYGLIAADEALHSRWVAALLPGDDRDGSDDFNRFIDNVIAEASFQPLAYLMQVVLEGFGITHYAALAAHARDAAVAQTFTRLMRDECVHHSSGKTVLEPAMLTSGERVFLEASTAALLAMFRCGPQSVVRALGEKIGGLDECAAKAVFDALECEATAAAKLARLRHLMSVPGMRWLVEALDARGLFTPLPARDCARIFISS